MNGKIGVAAVSVIAVVAVTATTSILASGEQSRPQGPMMLTGTIRGVLALVGGPANNPPTPVPGSIVAEWIPQKHADDDSPRFTAATDANGAFSLAVPSGEYFVSGTSVHYGGGQGVCRTDSNDIWVAPGGSTEVIVACDMK